MPAAPHPDAPTTPAAPQAAARTRARLIALAVVVALGVTVAAAVAALSHRSGTRPAGDVAATAPAASAELGELRISRDFGATTLLHRQLSIPASATAMSLLADHADVETRYGGGFVNAIDGLASSFSDGGGLEADWFYYVNGLQADRGAADYAISGRDREWWDFHRWDFSASVPAVVGQFPQPFLSGAGRVLPTVVIHPIGFETPAEEIVAALEAAGVRDVSAVSLATSVESSGDRHAIYVGTWDELSEIPEIADAAANPASSGLFAHFDRGRLVTFDSHGETAESDLPAGVVVATVRADAPDAALWVVSGLQAGDVDNAVALLGGGAPRLVGRFGVAVHRDGSTVALPTEPAK